MAEGNERVSIDTGGLPGIPVALRGSPDRIGLLVTTQVVGKKPDKAALALPEGQKQAASLTAVAVVAIPGKFAVVPIEELIPLIDIRATVLPAPVVDDEEDPPPAEAEQY